MTMKGQGSTCAWGCWCATGTAEMAEILAGDVRWEREGERGGTGDSERCAMGSYCEYGSDDAVESETSHRGCTRRFEGGGAALTKAVAHGRRRRQHRRCRTVGTATGHAGDDVTRIGDTEGVCMVH
jgi:hypothetical protein